MLQNLTCVIDSKGNIDIIVNHLQRDNFCIATVYACRLARPIADVIERAIRDYGDASERFNSNK